MVADLAADQGCADGALIADAVQVHIGLGGAGQVVLLGVLRIIALGQNLDMHTDGGGIVGQLALVHDACQLEGGLQIGNAGLHRSLLLLGGIILGVLAQVAIAAGNLDLVGNFLTLDGAQVFQFLLQFIIALAGNDNFFSHSSVS